MERPDPAFEDLMLRVVAQRIVIEQFMTSIIVSLGQTKEQFDAFAGHVKSVVGITNPDDPQAGEAAKHIPDLLKHIEAILTEVRRGMPA